MTEMGQERVQSPEREGAGGGLEVPGVEPGELGPAEPESSPQAADAVQSVLGDSAAQHLAEPGSERLGADIGGEGPEPGEAGPAEPATDALPGELGQFPGDLGQAAGSVERSVSGDLGQVTGDVREVIGTAGSAERVVSGDAGKAMGSAESAGKGIAERAGQVAESILPGGDAPTHGHQAEEPGPRVEPGLAHDDTEAKPAQSGAEAPGQQPGLRLDTPQAPEQAPRSQPR